MSDRGFGTGLFGEGPFGVSDYVDDALWQDSVPDGIKLDDSEAADGDGPGDLERILRGPAKDIMNRVYRLVEELPEQRHPLTAVSGQEEARQLDVDSAQRVSSSRVLVRLVENESNDEILRDMFPRTRRDDGTPRTDGWVANINGVNYRIEEVDAYEREIVISTEQSVPTTQLEVRPPDLLSLIGSNWNTIVDRQDPPDYTRRALYRQPLLRDLKVSERLFELVGALYGFQVEVEGLWCIDEDIYETLKQQKPRKVYDVEFPPGSGRTQYLTECPLLRYRYDEVAMDVVSMDEDEPTTASGALNDPVELEVTVTSVTDLGNDRYRLNLDSADEDSVDDVGDLGHWRIIVGGDEHWIEAKNESPPWVEVIAASAPPTGDAELAIDPRPACQTDYKPAAAYAIDARIGQIANEPGAQTGRLFDRIQRKIEKYIPVHIRLVVLTFVSRSRTILPFLGASRSSMSGVMTTTTFVLERERYDLTPMDEQPMDENVFQIRSTFTSP